MSTVRDDNREVVGWMMYDWANSAFQTTVVTVLLGPYLTALAHDAVGENGIVLSLGALGVVTAKSLFPYSVSLSVFLQVFLLPVLGAIADYTPLKKRLMAAFCYTGVVATCLLFFVTGRLYLAGGILFIVANLSFGVFDAAVVLGDSDIDGVNALDWPRRGLSSGDSRSGAASCPGKHVRRRRVSRRSR